MRISDWSSDVCSSDLFEPAKDDFLALPRLHRGAEIVELAHRHVIVPAFDMAAHAELLEQRRRVGGVPAILVFPRGRHREDKSFHIGHRFSPLFLHPLPRSEEHTSELQSLMRISYAVFCLKK